MYIYVKAPRCHILEIHVHTYVHTHTQVRTLERELHDARAREAYAERQLKTHLAETRPATHIHSDRDVRANKTAHVYVSV